MRQASLWIVTVGLGISGCRKAEPPPPPPATGPTTASDGVQTLARAEGLLQLGSAAAAAELLRQLDDETLAPARRRLLAWALSQIGDHDELEALVGGDDDDELTFIRDAARAHGDAGARRRLRERWRNAPDSTWGLLALRAWAEIDTQLPARERRIVLDTLPPPRPSSRFSDDAALALALEALRTALPTNAKLAREVDYALGVVALRAERFSQASEHLARGLAGNDAELSRAARYHLALAEQRRGNYDVAQRELVTLAKRNDRWGVLALAAQGQMAVESLRYDDARQLYTTHLFESPIAGAREQALWGLGWVAFRTGSYAEARRFFTTLANEAPFGAFAAAASYFGGRAADELGQTTLAQGAFCQTLQRFPTDYYAYRAQARLALSTSCTPPSESVPSELEQVERYMSAAMHERAQRGLRPLLRRTATLGPRALVGMHTVLTTLGHNDRAQKLEVVLARRFAQGPDVLRILGDSYLTPEAAALRHAAKAERVSAEVLLAVAQTRSAMTLGKVGARGELGPFQLPRAALAALLREERKARTVISNDLVDADTAVRLGTRYTGRLLRSFGTRLEYAIAALHAPPGAVTRWREGRGELPGEIFVEEIPYAECKTFVKDVLAAVQTQRHVESARNAAQLAAAQAHALPAVPPVR